MFAFVNCHFSLLLIGAYLSVDGPLSSRKLCNLPFLYIKRRRSRLKMTRKREMNQMMMMTKFLKMTMCLMSLMQILLNILKVISSCLFLLMISCLHTSKPVYSSTVTSLHTHHDHVTSVWNLNIKYLINFKVTWVQGHSCYTGVL